MGDFKRSQYFNFEISFLKSGKLFSKNRSAIFKFKLLQLKKQHFQAKLNPIKTSVMGITKRTYHKEPLTAFFFFFFLKIRFLFKDLL